MKRRIRHKCPDCGCTKTWEDVAYHTDKTETHRLYCAAWDCGKLIEQWVAKTVGAALMLALMLSCTKEPVCYECRYKEQTWTICDMTEAQIDSIQRVFNTGCEEDLLTCKTIEP